LAVFACAFGAAAHPAFAQEEPETLIKQGVDMRKQGDDIKAHGYFQRAYDIARTPRSAAQLGLSDLSVDDNLAAEQHLTEALASSDPWIAKNRDLLQKSRDKARSRLGRVAVGQAPADATVEVAGRAAVPLPADRTIWIPPNGAELRFAAPGHKPFTTSVTVAAGASATLEVDLPALPAAPGAGPTEGAPAAPSLQPGPAREAPPEQAGRPWQKTAAWVSGGVGVALLGMGITSHVLYASKIDEFNSYAAPNSSHQCDKAMTDNGGGNCTSLLNSANTRLTFAVIGYAAGGAALAGALIFALTAPSAHAAGSDTTAACSPNGGKGISCGLSVRF
jgi:hypothetical protein